MSPMSRREALGAIAMAGAASVARAHSHSPQTGSPAGAVLSAKERSTASEQLLNYFHRVGPTLFRDPSGYLKHPTLSPSQPGKQYSTELWDWDTYWTARGLLRLANLTKDEPFRKQIIEHAQGSLAAFFEAQSSEGRIPIMISAKKQDFFESTKKMPRNPHNQCKPVSRNLLA